MLSNMQKRKILTHREKLNKTGKRVLNDKITVLYLEINERLVRLESVYENTKSGLMFTTFKKLRSQNLQLLKAIELIQKEVSNA